MKQVRPNANVTDQQPPDSSATECVPDPVTDDRPTEDVSVNNKKQKCAAKTKCRKYEESYLNFGFVAFPGSKSSPQPQCVICSQVLSNAALRPSKLIRHLHTKHGHYKERPRVFFERKAKELSGTQAEMKASTAVDKKLLKISYVVAQKIAQEKKPHTIGETLIMPCATEIVKELFGEEKAKQLANIPMSNDTVKRRISSMSEDIQVQCATRLQGNDFAIQLDESIDVSKMSHLLAYVRYEWEKEIREDFLFCKELKTTTTAKYVFEALDDFMSSNGISWANCIGVCTDGAAAMTGRHSGVVQRIKAVAPRAVSMHCVLHRDALAAKDIDPGLHEILNNAVTIVNFVKARATNSRLFTALCEEVGSDHHSLLMHTDVRWLSRGNMLTRLFSLREELHTFLSDKKPELAELLKDEKWLAQLSYLADIFNETNKLNKTMQGGNTNIITQHERVEAFKRKLEMWKNRASSGMTDMFKQLHAFLQEKKMDFRTIKRQVRAHLAVHSFIHSLIIIIILKFIHSFIQVTAHLAGMLDKFNSYFPELSEEEAASYLWIKNPFTENIETKLPDTYPSKLLEELIDISSDTTWRARFSEVSLETFWCECGPEYHASHEAAVKVLIPFSTTYLCEAGFSAMTALKTKYRARLSLEDDMRVALSQISPRIDRIISRQQQQASH